MRKGGGKQKGASFEREVAVALSKWASRGEREDLFWRSSMSGGRATVARKRGTKLASQAGDLSCINPMGQPFLDKFYVELKHYKDLSYQGLITNTGYLVKFWNQAQTEANCYVKQPMLIAKQNHIPSMVFITWDGMKALGLSEFQTVIQARRLNLNGFLFDDFVKWAYPID